MYLLVMLKGSFKIMPITLNTDKMKHFIHDSLTNTIYRAKERFFLSNTAWLDSDKSFAVN